MGFFRKLRKFRKKLRKLPIIKEFAEMEENPLMEKVNKIKFSIIAPNASRVFSAEQRMEDDLELFGALKKNKKGRKIY